MLDKFSESGIMNISKQQGVTNMTKTESHINNLFNSLQGYGLSFEDIKSLRRISMTLRRWYELECGNGFGMIERDETTQKPFWVNARTLQKFSVNDRETGALKRLQNIMKKFSDLSYYVQTDPRGAALYLIRPNDVPAGESLNAWYSRGICIY